MAWLRTHPRCARRPARLHGAGWTRVAALLLAALLTGCQAIKLTYNNLDWLAGWQLARFVDLAPPQKSLFDDRFREFWGWHRATQLVIYAQDLRQLATDAGRPLTPAQVEAYMERGRAHMARAMQEAVPNIAQILRTFDASQVEELLENLAERREKSRKESLDLSRKELAERAEEQMIKNLKRWIGSPNRAQRSRIREWAAARQYAGTIWHQYQEAWAAGFTQALAHRNEPQFDDQLRAFFDGGEVPYREDMEKVRTHNRRLLIGVLADLSAMLTPEQRRRFEDNLRELAADLDELAAQTRAATRERAGSSADDPMRPRKSSARLCCIAA